MNGNATFGGTIVLKDPAHHTEVMCADADTTGRFVNDWPVTEQPIARIVEN